jgi:Integral peroxisomal membrane peroxin
MTQQLSCEDKKTSEDVYKILQAVVEHVLPLESETSKNNSFISKFNIKRLIEQGQNFSSNAKKTDSQLAKMYISISIILMVLSGIFYLIEWVNKDYIGNISNQIGIFIQSVQFFLLTIAFVLILVILFLPGYMFLGSRKEARKKGREILRDKIKFVGEQDEKFIKMLARYGQTAIKIAEERIQSLILEMEKEEKIAFEIAPGVVVLTIAIIIYFKLIPTDSGILAILGLALIKYIFSGIFKYFIVSETQSAIFIYKKSLSFLKEAQLRKTSEDSF